MASSAAAASAGSSMIAKYISKVRAGLRRQRPEAREAWLEAEMDSMQIGSSHQGKPSLRDVCRYLNLAVSEKQKWLNKQTLVKNLVEKLMSEAVVRCRRLPVDGPDATVPQCITGPARGSHSFSRMPVRSGACEACVDCGLRRP